jgi:hypothetical protein
VDFGFYCNQERLEAVPGSHVSTNASATDPVASRSHFFANVHSNDFHSTDGDNADARGSVQALVWPLIWSDLCRQSN